MLDMLKAETNIAAASGIVVYAAAPIATIKHMLIAVAALAAIVTNAKTSRHHRSTTPTIPTSVGAAGADIVAVSAFIPATIFSEPALACICIRTISNAMNTSDVIAVPTATASTTATMFMFTRCYNCCCSCCCSRLSSLTPNATLWQRWPQSPHSMETTFQASTMPCEVGTVETSQIRSSHTTEPHAEPEAAGS